ncbi:MAG TPA: SDR family oxidoreductase [Tepidisphaeraceae bacterium]|jgi:NAD(P)-dependent dehydrogenase (short-subunit alcohol dehydrogenase family)|nr:SDR family oxidoreductase [Tepidisphaeraceae bacterium]
MADRVALVTGAGRGIGLGIVRALASAGCAVAIQDIDEAVAREQAELINREGGRAIALGGDLTDHNVAAALPEKVVNRFESLHVLVNNASIQSQVDWTKADFAEMNREIETNLLVPIVLAQKSVPFFRKHNWGRILNIGSIQQTTGNAGMLAYSLSKAALEKMTTALAKKLAAEHITVNLIAPGYFDTLRNQKDAPRMDVIAKHIPMHRIGQPEDCGGIALALCSDAGAYITGQSIYVDGGMSVA